MKKQFSIKQRLMLAFIPPLLMAGILALLVTLDQAKPYKEIAVGPSKLYVPKHYLTEEKTDITGMLQDYFGSLELERYQFIAYADDILPLSVALPEPAANSRIIWTVAAANTAQSNVPAPEGAMLPEDAALFYGEGRHAGRTVSFNEEHQLYRLVSPSHGHQQYVFSNQTPDTQNTGDAPWITHCIELSAIRPNAPWGRCTLQLTTATLRVQVHYDGRLVKETAALSHSLVTRLQKWQHKPKE